MITEGKRAARERAGSIHNRAGLILSFVAAFVLVGVSVSGTSALSDSTITVCQAGPPQCDYQTIQEGIDAAAAGDTVLVSAGAYTGQVTLKSNVALESSDGPEVTVITATVGPVVTATNVVSVAITGFTISGQGIVTVPVGVDLLDSSLTISGCVIEDLHGAAGRDAEPNGEDAVAVRSKGTGTLAIEDTIIQDISGGDGFAVLGGATGGDAVGIRIDGVAKATITATTIRRVIGGAAGSETWAYGCKGTGGRAIGIRTQGGTDLAVSDSEIAELVGGMPCRAVSIRCIERAGPAVGVQAAGGTVVLRDNLLESLSAWVGHGSEPSYGVHTSFTSGTYLDGNTVAFLSSLGTAAQLHSLRPESPFCVPPPRTVIAVASEGDALLQMTGNSLEGLSGAGVGGRAVGISVKNVIDVELSKNHVRGITGGSACIAAIGIDIQGANTVDISANGLGRIYGGDAPPPFYYAFFGLPGGGAAGIALTAVAGVTVTNNSVWLVAGGRGTDANPAGWPPEGGGDAVALYVTQGTAGVRNNTFYRTVAGLGGDPGGQRGDAIGLHVTGDADVLAINNAVIGHGVGISSTSSITPLLGYNNLWDNEVDYSGTPPGASDLHVAHGFVDAENGDFHLKPDSLMIDAGTNVGASDRDFEGEPRPLDGDDDGVSTADIGADEYWPDWHGSAKVVDRLVAAPGDRLSYHLTLVNPSNWHDLPGVMLTDTIPTWTTYVDGTLWGTKGAWGYAGGVITWIGTVSAGETVTLTFDAVISGDLTGPHAIINQAVLDDRIGKAQTVQAITFVDPLRVYLPVIFAESALH